MLPESELMLLASRQARRDAQVERSAGELVALRGELAAERGAAARLREQLHEAAMDSIA